jgi:hypothetical protein
MATSHDELAGVVDLFGALTHEELCDALSELAFKAGREANEEAIAGRIAAATEAYALVEFEGSDETLLVPGPTAFPELPPDATDLPHIMSVPDREVDRGVLGEQVVEELLAAAEASAGDAEGERTELREVSYDVEAWANVDASAVRARLD